MGDFSILASRIKELRKSIGKTQREFASKVGCTAATLSAYENGSKSPSLEIVKNVAEKCDVSIDWLCGLIDKKNYSNEIKTYSDLYELLFKIEKDTHIAFETITREGFIMGYDGAEPYADYTQSIYFDNEKIGSFLEEWEKMKSVHDKGIIDDDIYSLWKEKILSNPENINEHLDGSFEIDDAELPFK